jgi:ATP sulfurylase
MDLTTLTAPQTNVATVETVMLETVTLKEFMSKHGFTQIVKDIRSNKNGIPYLTFITADNKAENIYFSKRLALKAIEGELITTLPLKDIVFNHLEYTGQFDDVFNDQGVLTGKVQKRRWKIASGNSNRFTLDDLASLF